MRHPPASLWSTDGYWDLLCTANKIDTPLSLNFIQTRQKAIQGINKVTPKAGGSGKKIVCCDEGVWRGWGRLLGQHLN